MTAKIKLKVGPVEFEWEGDEKFLKEEIPGLLSFLTKQFRETISKEESIKLDQKPPNKFRNTFTTSSLAAKTAPKSSTDLFVLALYKLNESDEISMASRGQIHDEMKAVPRFYQANMLSNLSKTITTLLGKNLINEPVQGKYVLSQTGVNEINRKLGDDKSD